MAITFAQRAVPEDLARRQAGLRRRGRHRHDPGSGITWRFYPGEESLLPDPLIASIEREDAPAHRGLAYIVFGRVPLDRLGTRMPNLTLELAGNATRNVPEQPGRPPGRPRWWLPGWPVLGEAWAAARLPRIALGYAGLAFLGFGADAGRPDWGAMVWEDRTHALGAPWLPVAPILGLVLLVLAVRLALRRAGLAP